MKIEREFETSCYCNGYTHALEEKNTSTKYVLEFKEITPFKDI